ncbi:type II secretion system protein [Vibrio profundi]|uniref:type II secretion system protein n=1 Tax=Vibrio profundi TaxID=1774960 RepID=UPI003735DE09
MSKTKGFTLLELIASIVIMAFVASGAMMKFSQVQADARASKIGGVAGNLRTGIDMVFAKSAIAGVEDTCTSGTKVEVEGYFVCYGYPIAFINAIERLMNIDTNEETAKLYVRNKADDDEHQNPDEQEHLIAAITFFKDHYTYNTEGSFCQVLYQPHKEPQIITLLDGC